MKSLLNKVSSDRHFLRSGTISLAVGVLGTLVQLVFGIVLARSLGPSGYGIYAYTFLLTSIIVIPIGSGLYTYLLRAASRLYHCGDLANFTRMLLRALIATALYSCIAYIILAPVIFLFHKASAVGSVYYLSFTLLLTLAMSKTATAASYAANKVNYGQFLTRILQPLIGVVGLAAFWLYRSRHGLHLTFNDGLAVQSLSLAVTSVLAIAACRHALDFHRKAQLTSGIGKPTASSISYLTLSGVVLFANAQADMFVLGLLGSAASVGVYKIAVTASSVAAMPIMAFNTILSPRISQMYVSERAQLQSLLKTSAKLTTVCALAALAVFIVFGRFLIAHVFGAAYGGAYWPMVILSVGQVANCATGSVGNVLNMTGKEAWLLRGTVVSGVFNVVACAVLTYKFGLLGAASATAASNVLWNLIMTLQQRRLVGLRCAAVDAWGL